MKEKPMKTYPEMNEAIKDILKYSDKRVDQYALARITELENEVESLKNEVKQLMRESQQNIEGSYTLELLVSKFGDALRDIDIHIRSIPEPIPYIVETLKQTLPEYKEGEE